MKLKIEAGNHELVSCPVRFESDEPILNHNFALARKNIVIPAQYAGKTNAGKHEYVFILNSLKPGISAEFEIVEPKKPPADSAKSIVTDKSVDIILKGAVYTSYYFGADIPKPYLGPFCGKKGEPITRHGYSGSEHPHHRSIWFSHGDINKTDTWNEPEGIHGYIENKEISGIINGAAYTQFTAKNLWTHHDKSPIADDSTTIAVYNTPENRRIIDASLTLSANYGDITLGSTKEAGPIAVRMADNYIVPNGGRIENSFGGINESEIWMKRAHWNDYCGRGEFGDVYGVAILDNPQNPGYPSYFHTRDYGLMAANNFHLGGEEKIAAGESVTYKYRIAIHGGDAKKAKIAQLFANYIFAPKASVN
ncbi:MAG: PmoA family protein [Oscillospiraceae bacterium]|nr:PmoA family protein [Oscillospiraceae bacterium]